eukprot:tig00000269_g23766.t1
MGFFDFLDDIKEGLQNFGKSFTGGVSQIAQETGQGMKTGVDAVKGAAVNTYQATTQGIKNVAGKVANTNIMEGLKQHLEIGQTAGTGLQDSAQPLRRSEIMVQGDDDGDSPVGSYSVNSGRTQAPTVLARPANATVVNNYNKLAPDMQMRNTSLARELDDATLEIADSLLEEPASQALATVEAGFAADADAAAEAGAEAEAAEAEAEVAWL